MLKRMTIFTNHNHACDTTAVCTKMYTVFNESIINKHSHSYHCCSGQCSGCGSGEWSGVQCRGVEWGGVERWSGVECMAVEWTALEWSACQWSGVHASGVDSAGVECMAVEWTALEWSARQWSGQRWNGTEWSAWQWSGQPGVERSGVHSSGVDSAGLERGGVHGDPSFCEPSWMDWASQSIPIQASVVLDCWQKGEVRVGSKQGLGAGDTREDLGGRWLASRAVKPVTYLGGL